MTKENDNTNAYDVSDRPLYEPEVWNQDGVIKTANCYAYAVDDPFGHYRKPSPFQPGRVLPLPGEAQSKDISALSVKEITKLAVGDGLIKAPDDAPEKAGYYLVALTIRPGVDFHWYRKDMDGTWSHKPGTTPVSKVDDSGKPITNPELADRGKYTDFGGYFYVPRGGMEIGSKVAFERMYHEFMEKDAKGELDKTRKGFLENLYKPKHKENMEYRKQNQEYHSSQEEKKAAILQAEKSKLAKIEKISENKDKLRNASTNKALPIAMLKGGREV